MAHHINASNVNSLTPNAHDSTAAESWESIIINDISNTDDNSASPPMSIESADGRVGAENDPATSEPADIAPSMATDGDANHGVDTSTADDTGSSVANASTVEHVDHAEQIPSESEAGTEVTTSASTGNLKPAYSGNKESHLDQVSPQIPTIAISRVPSLKREDAFFDASDCVVSPYDEVTHGSKHIKACPVSMKVSKGVREQVMPWLVNLLVGLIRNTADEAKGPMSDVDGELDGMADMLGGMNIRGGKIRMVPGGWIE